MRDYLFDIQLNIFDSLICASHLRAWAKLIFSDFFLYLQEREHEPTIKKRYEYFCLKFDRYFPREFVFMLILVLLFCHVKLYIYATVPF